MYSAPVVISESQRTSVFISYRRSDRDQAESLAREFERQGFTVSADWSLPAGAPYPQVLSGWIQQAHIFVFLLTPDYLASEACMDEFEEAHRSGKRLAPIRIREVDAIRLPREMQPIHWTVFERDGDAAEAVRLIREGFTRDFAWEREHHRLSYRALDWVKNGRTQSQRLRREDLRAAESWLDGTLAEQPELANRLSGIAEYVRESRRREQRSRNIETGSAIVALLFLLGLSLFGLLQFRRAAASETDRRGQAELAASKSAEAEKRALEALEANRLAEANRAEASRQYARAEVESGNAARRRLDNIEERARQFLLSADAEAAAAYLTLVAASGPPSRDAQANPGFRFMLARAAASLQGRVTVFPGNLSSIVTVALRPDGKQILSVSEDGTAAFWDAMTGQRKHVLGQDSGGRVLNATYTPDGRRVIVVQGTGSEFEDGVSATESEVNARMLDSESRKEINSWHLSSQEVRVDEWQQPVFTRDGRAFYLKFENAASPYDDITLAAFSVVDGQLVRKGGRWPFTIEEPSKCADRIEGDLWRSPAHRLVLDRKGILYQEPECSYVTRLEGPLPIQSAAFSRDGRRILIAHDRVPILWDWAAAVPSLAAQIDIGDKGASWSTSNGREILISTDSHIERWEIQGPKRLSRMKIPSGFTCATLIPFTQRALVWHPENGAALFDAISGDILTKLDGRLVELASGCHVRVDWARNASVIVLREQTSPDETGPKATFDAFDLKTGAVLGEGLEPNNGPRDAMALSPDGRSLFASGTRRGYETFAWVSPLDNWEAHVDLEDTGADAPAVAAFTADGSAVVGAGFEGSLRVWAVTSGRRMLEMPFRIGGVSRIALTKDARYAVVSNGTQSEILDLKNPKTVGLCEGITAGDTAAFSPDGALVATSGLGNAVRIYELATGRLLSVFNTPGSTRDARFSPDGHRLLVQSGTVTQLWNTAPDRRPAQEIADMLTRVGTVFLDSELIERRGLVQAR